jgi:uncharacterized integral membrane protein
MAEKFLLKKAILFLIFFCMNTTCGALHAPAFRFQIPLFQAVTFRFNPAWS